MIIPLGSLSIFCSCISGGIKSPYLLLRFVIFRCCYMPYYSLTHGAAKRLTGREAVDSIGGMPDKAVHVQITKT